MWLKGVLLEEGFLRSVLDGFLDDVTCPQWTKLSVKGVSLQAKSRGANDDMTTRFPRTRMNQLLHTGKKMQFVVI